MIYGTYWTQIICRVLEGFHNVFHTFQNLPDGFLPLPTFPWYLEESCKCWERWVVTYLLAISHSPTPPPPTNRLVTALESGLMSILASAGHRWFLQNQGHLKGSTMKVDVYIYCILYIYISSWLKKTCHFKGGSTGGHSQDKHSTKLKVNLATHHAPFQNDPWKHDPGHIPKWQ